MPLAEEQKTAKNFHEFYSMIRPYLNGSFPTPIVNKFSKGDLYSTEEKIIGQWIDGKPIWQKTVTGYAGASSSVSSTLDTISDIDEMIYAHGIIDCGTNDKRIAPNISSSIEKQGTNITFYTDSSQIFNKPLIVTIQYTKSTDSPISIGDGNDYSTDEQVVGTWIDGKPVYQKTIDCGLQSASTTTTTIEVAHNVSNIGTIKFVYEAFIIDATNNDSNLLPVVNISASDMIGRIGITNSNITLKQAGGWSNWRAYITIRYTKTTD